MSLPSIHCAPLPAQRGAALITGLIFLVVLTMVGITSARMSTLEERMSGNMRDRSIAMQAAELALRDAERDIRNVVPASARGVSVVYPVGTNTCFRSAAPQENGFCNNGSGGYATPLWVANPEYWNDGAANSVPYGTFTGAAAIPGISIQPRYLIERFHKDFGGKTYFYRITARAQGANPNTVVWLQEVYRFN
jgi:type IV pilus assembly protein PilX